MPIIPPPKTKNFNLYPLLVLPRDLKIDPNFLFECVAKERIPLNVVRTYWNQEAITYTIIGDSLDGRFVRGRFLKLIKDDIGRIDLEKLKEEIITNGPSEYVEENSHFIYDTSLNLVLAEYNPGGVNVLTKRASQLLDNAIKKCARDLRNIIVNPIPSEEFIEQIVGTGFTKSARIHFERINLKYLEDKGATSSLISALAEEEGFDLGIFAKMTVPRPLSVEKFKGFKELADKFKGKADSLKVNTDEGNFDIIKDNLLYFNAEIERSNTDIMRLELFSKMQERLITSAPMILRIVDKNPTLMKDY
jgi:hypothetical protein